MTALQGHRPEIDGLRAIAVLSVIFYHFGFYAFPGGYVGVDIFFVISGFLITGKILGDCKNGKFSFGVFYARRITRLAPALLFVIIASSFAGYFVLLPPDLNEYARSVVSAIFGFSNFYFFFNTDYFDAASVLRPMLHTWSLGVEEQFYFLWPFVIYTVCNGARHPRRQLMLWIIGIILTSFVASLLLVARDPKQAFYLPHARVWELAVGGLLVLMPPVSNALAANVARLVGLSALIASICLYTPLMPFPGLAAVLPCAGAVLMLWPAVPRTVMDSVLASRGLAFLGKISYSLYLWHWPAIVYFLYRQGHHPESLAEIAFSLSVIFVLATFSWKFVEQPPRRLHLPVNRIFALFGLSAAAVLSTYVLVASTDGLSFRYSSAELAIINNIPVRGAILQDGVSCSGRTVDNACLIGKTGGTPTWAVVGDSHAETLLQSLDKGFRERGVTALVLTRPGCPFISNVIRLDTRMDCGQFNAQVMAKILGGNIRHVLVQDRANAYISGKPFDNGEGGVEPGADFPVSVTHYDYPERQSDVSVELTSTLSRVLASGLDVYYFLAPPEAGWNVPKKVLQQLKVGEPPPSTSLLRYLERNASLINLLNAMKSQSRLHVIESYRAFCSYETGRCQTVGPEGIFYTDTDHLSTVGAERLTGLFFSNLDR